MHSDIEYAQTAVYPSSKCQDVHSGVIVGARLRSGKDVFRRSAAAHCVSWRVPDGRNCIRISSASGYLVLGADVSDQLVDAHLRHHDAQCDGFSSSILLAPRSQWLESIQLPGLESVEPIL